MGTNKKTNKVPFQDAAQVMEDAMSDIVAGGEKPEELSDCGVDAAHGEEPRPGGSEQNWLAKYLKPWTDLSKEEKIDFINRNIRAFHDGDNPFEPK